MDTMPRRDKQTAGARKKPRRTGRNLQAWIPAELRDAVDASANRNRRSLTTEVIIALEKYLSSEGLWPPPSAGNNPAGAGKGDSLIP